VIGLENYQKKNSKPLEFYYVHSEKNIPESKLVPGQKLSYSLMEEMKSSFFDYVDIEGIIWEGKISQQERYFLWDMTAIYQDMHIPFPVRIFDLENINIRPMKQTLTLFMNPQVHVTYFSYAEENRLAIYVYEIMKKLELISDMAAYDIVNEILKTESVSGRHIMEKMSELSETEPRVLRQKRLEQIAEYRNYTYMKQRWERYQKNKRQEKEEWEFIIDRFMNFITPIWTALCNNEIFFDDWMPELGRFLG
jgi:hypothetical protein